MPNHGFFTMNKSLFAGNGLSGQLICPLGDTRMRTIVLYQACLVPLNHTILSPSCIMDDSFQPSSSALLQEKFDVINNKEIDQDL